MQFAGRGRPPDRSRLEDAPARAAPQEQAARTAAQRRLVRPARRTAASSAIASRPQKQGAARGSHARRRFAGSATGAFAAGLQRRGNLFQKERPEPAAHYSRFESQTSTQLAAPRSRGRSPVSQSGYTVWQSAGLFQPDRFRTRARARIPEYPVRGLEIMDCFGSSTRFSSTRPDRSGRALRQGCPDNAARWLRASSGARHRRGSGTGIRGPSCPRHDSPANSMTIRADLARRTDVAGEKELTRSQDNRSISNQVVSIASRVASSLNRSIRSGSA